MSDEEKKRKRDEIKGRLQEAFNRVADDKVVKINEFVSNFERVDDKYFLTASRWNPLRLKQGIVEKMAEDKMRELAQRTPPAERGVYTAVENGREQTYVTAAWMKRRMISGVASGRADEHLAEAEQAGLATIEAIAVSPDHSEGVRSGQIKPKTSKPK